MDKTVRISELLRAHRNALMAVLDMEGEITKLFAADHATHGTVTVTRLASSASTPAPMTCAPDVAEDRTEKPARKPRTPRTEAAPAPEAKPIPEAKPETPTAPVLPIPTASEVVSDAAKTQAAPEAKPETPAAPAVPTVAELGALMRTAMRRGVEAAKVKTLLTQFGADNVSALTEEQRGTVAKSCIDLLAELG